MTNRLLTILALVIFVVSGRPVHAESVGDYGKIMEGIEYAAKAADTMMWVIDKSPSMSDDISEVHSRIEGLMESYRKRGREVEVGIVTYADRPSLHQAPTTDAKELKKAFGKIKTRGSGKEALYGAIEMAVDKMKRGKYPFLILVTDEAGDDDKKLESITKTLVKKNIKVLVLSPNATFGHRDWHWDVISMKDKNTTFFNSQNGPESLTIEALFDFHFTQRSTWSKSINPMEYRTWAVKSGWAPFGLQLMADMTGGQVFELDTDTCKLDSGFTEDNKKLYAPDIDFPSQVKKRISKHSWRSAVNMAVEYWAKNFSEIEREWPGQSKAALISGVESQVPTIRRNIRTADKVIDMLRAALDAPLKARGYSLEEEVPQNLRWRANLELALASALVARYHANQFLADIERFKKPDFWPDPQNDVCQFNIKIVADRKPLFDDELKKEGYQISGVAGMSELIDVGKLLGDELPEDVKGMRIQAEKALKVVMHNHPETPWAAMARKLFKKLGHYDVFINPCGNWGNSTQTQ